MTKIMTTSDCQENDYKQPLKELLQVTTKRMTKIMIENGSKDKY